MVDTSRNTFYQPWGADKDARGQSLAPGLACMIDGVQVQTFLSAHPLTPPTWACQSHIRTINTWEDVTGFPMPEFDHVAIVLDNQPPVDLTFMEFDCLSGTGTRDIQGLVVYESSDYKVVIEVWHPMLHHLGCVTYVSIELK